MNVASTSTRGQWGTVILFSVKYVRQPTNLYQWWHDVLSQTKFRRVPLTHWGRVTHICVCKLTIIGSDNDLSPERRQAIIWTNAGILLIGPLATNFSEILVEIQTFSLKKVPLKMSSAKCCSFRLGLNALTHWGLVMHKCWWTWSSVVDVMACHMFS